MELSYFMEGTKMPEIVLDWFQDSLELCWQSAAKRKDGMKRVYSSLQWAWLMQEFTDFETN